MHKSPFLTRLAVAAVALYMAFPASAQTVPDTTYTANLPVTVDRNTPHQKVTPSTPVTNPDGSLIGSGGSSGGPVTAIAGAFADGALTTFGLKADAANCNINNTAMACFRQLHADMIAATPAGSNLIGGINLAQFNGATPSITNPFFIANAEAADTTGTLTAASQSVSNSNADGFATGLISLHGTYSGSASFVVSDDGGTTFYPVLCARSDGTASETGFTALTNVSRMWICPVSGNDTLAVQSTGSWTGSGSVRVGISAPSPNSGVIAGQVGITGSNGGAIATGADNALVGSDVIPSAAQVTATGGTYNASTGAATATANAQSFLINTAGYNALSFYIGSGSATFAVTTGETAAGPFSAQSIDFPSNTGTLAGQSGGTIPNTEVTMNPGGQYVMVTITAFTSTQTFTLKLRSQRFPLRIVGTNLLTGTNTVGNVGHVSAGTPVTASSGNVANASAVATLAGVASKTTWITGFQITSDGATVGGCVSPTVTGVISGTMTFTYCVPAGVTSGATPLIVSLPTPVPASTTNTAIAVTLPALGAGSTNATVTSQGFQL